MKERVRPILHIKTNYGEVRMDLPQMLEKPLQLLVTFELTDGSEILDTHYLQLEVSTVFDRLEFR